MTQTHKNQEKAVTLPKSSEKNSLKEKMQIDIEKFPIKRFFVESESFMYGETTDQKMQEEEFARLKKTCFTSYNFLCVNIKYYESGMNRLKEANLRWGD